MSLCFFPTCLAQNERGAKSCHCCGNPLLLRERYRAIRQIGQGGFGRTFLAIDEKNPDQSYCVVKQFFPLSRGTNFQRAARLFEQEAVRLAAVGSHPQIPELVAYFSQGGEQYLVQEYIDGQNLAEELKQEGVFNEQKIRSLLAEVLLVLQFVHANEIVHRDIKPLNLIRRRSDGKLVLVDFGAAKCITGAAFNVTGTVIGSAEFIAPEQLQGKATFASDLYSLGVTCIYLLTQVSPFDLYDSLEGQWVWRQYLNGNSVSQNLGKVLERLVETAGKYRYQNATEVLEDLKNSPKKPSRRMNLSVKRLGTSAPEAKFKIKLVSLVQIFASVSLKALAWVVAGSLLLFLGLFWLQLPLLVLIFCFFLGDKKRAVLMALGLIVALLGGHLGTAFWWSNRQFDWLENSLKQEKWQEADWETQDFYTHFVSEAENLSCERLRRIDELWQKYSKGRFGLSIQKKIYLETGNKLGKYNREAFQRFGNRVGWRENGAWVFWTDPDEAQLRAGFFPQSLEYSAYKSYAGQKKGRTLFREVSSPSVGELMKRVDECNL